VGSGKREEDEEKRRKVTTLYASFVGYNVTKIE
jgi:hypothetical protein